MERVATPSGRWILAGGLWGALGVALGAYGAHGLEASAEGLAWWRTGVLYHLVHAPLLVLVGTAFAGRAGRTGGALLLGSVLFSGTLYAMALGGPRWLGAVTPVGGLLLIVGWLLLAVEGWRRAR